MTHNNITNNNITLITYITYLCSVYVLGDILYTLHVLKLHLTLSLQPYEENNIILNLKHTKFKKSV